jgi:non-specific serine/threonine protein kinase
MARLTPRLLDTYPYSRYADQQTILRGRVYFKEERIWDINLSANGSAVTCLVQGDAGEYAVAIELDQKSGQLYFDCDCPYAENHFCKHMVAAALGVSEYLNEEEDFEEEYEDERLPSVYSPRPQPAIPWQTRLEQTLANPPRSSAATGAQRYVAVLLLAKEEYYSLGSFQFLPWIIRARDWPVLQGVSPGDPAAINDLLETNREWIKHGEEMYAQVNLAGCLNLKPEAMAFLNFVHQYTRLFGGTQTITTYLPMIAKLEIPIFLASRYSRTVRGRAQILPEPLDVQVAFTQEGTDLVLRAVLQAGDWVPVKEKAQVISYSPPWLLLEDKIVSIQNVSNLSMLSSFPVVIPQTQADLFRRKYLRRIAETLPIRSDLIHWHEVTAAPVPRLYLHDDKDNKLRADLRFGYGDYELAATKSGESSAVETAPDSWDLIRIQRRLEREGEFYQLLTGPVYRLKRSDSRHPFGTFELRARAHPFDFLMYSVPELTRAGFEIYGEEQLKAGRINRARPALRVQITSGIDWFDLKAIVEFGDQQISLQDLRKAMKRGERYVKLADGSVGQIPQEWLDKYKHLWDLAEETEDGFRVSDLHLPLLDTLLEEDAALHAPPPPELRQRRERLRQFEQIASQPLPKGFVGELRPYQKHGFDWLHFLREYKFGGILADDMGLGKTVQMLAYLQSIKENGPERSRIAPEGGSAASLLVVPKSLLTNWQRESETFTPGLRFLEYMGNLRSRETSGFDAYDVVLTTYGTMLRDVEILRGYTFSHVILDESQAIKNPLAKQAKAARLLKADHRIVMTGTPVENNTFELWSQFAFLNPGLLGNMEYFKRAFANPIESDGDEAAAALLRKLIHPFILRRTKDQVAPELPPRTERVIYTDMEPAQKKVYIQTREKYRAEILGLLESEGMNETRFRILEGLLRLRQIAIHPGLVDRKYNGGAPKFDLLLETLETLHAENHKALVFSQFVETLKLVRRELDGRGIKYVYLDGQTPKRQSRVDLFQNDPSFPFFLISLKAGGVGLNLTAAEYVIHLDPWWNPAVEMQASDRAHRIGQDKPVFVYKIIARDTVEEKILQLQEKKRALVKSLIATEAGFFKSLTRDDVKALFS